VDTHEPRPGRVELVAYYTERPAGPPVTPREIAGALRDRLPRYMVPAYIERLARIPMLPSDKADRKNLPSPSGARLTAQGDHVEPATEVERVLADVVADLLDLDRVSVQSHFFDELGMSSLSLVQLRTSLRERPGMPAVTMEQAYLNPTVRELAAVVRAVAPRTQATARREVRVASTAAHLLCGAAQGLLFLVAPYVLLWGIATGYRWVAEGTDPLGIYLRVVLFGVLFFLATALLPVAVKWVLIGRWEPGEIPLWGWRYLRFWVVRQVLRANPMVLFTGTPLYLLYLRALGARVGRGAVVFARSMPVCTDLLTIGAGAVVRKDTTFPGYRAESGRIHIGRVDIGRGAVVGEGSLLDIDSSLGEDAQLGHASSLATGQHVPAGQRYAGSPARPTSTDFGGVAPLRCTRLRRVVYSAFQLAVLAMVTGPLMAALPLFVVPQVYVGVSMAAGAGGSGWTDPAFYLAHLAVAGIVLGGVLVLRLGAAVLVPRLAGRLVTADIVHPLYGMRFAAHRLAVRAGNSVLFTSLLGDSSFIVGFLRVIGYRLTPVQQTGTNFGMAVKHDSPLHVRVGTGTLVSDGLSVLSTRYSNSSFVVSEVTIGARSFLGNNIAYPARSVVGDDCLLATKVMIPIEGPRRSGVGLLGSPAFEIPRSTQGDPAMAAYHNGPGFSARLARKTRSNLLTIGLFLLQRLVLLYGTLLIFLGAQEFVGMLGVAAYSLGALAALVHGLVWGVLFERLSMGQRRLSPQFCSVYQPYFWRHERLWKLSLLTFLALFNGTPFKSVLWRLLGVRVGRKVFDDGAGIPEKTLVTIGDNVTINAGAVIQCHSLEDGTFRSDHTMIGADATLGLNSFVHYGVRVGERVVLDADAFLMKGEAPAADTRWRGNPATEVPQPEPAEVVPTAGPVTERVARRRSPVPRLAVTTRQ
jgi:non-ribosomal peptide synthetase-like protein